MSIFSFSKTKQSGGHFDLKKKKKNGGEYGMMWHTYDKLSQLYLNLPTHAFLREAEQGKTSLAYRRFKVSDGHSMFKPLEPE